MGASDAQRPEEGQIGLFANEQTGLSANQPCASTANEQTVRNAPEHPNVPSSDPFQDRHEFFDDVHGPVRLNDLERDVIDTPEFQRLFRIGQLGLVDLVFPTANHSRAVHSIGACFWAKKLVDALNENRKRLARSSSYDGWPEITRSERVVIGLAALVHDIPHGPFSHDIERKTHYLFTRDGRRLRVLSAYGLYPKHDDVRNNPALYVLLHDTGRSVLAKVLRRYSQALTQSILLENAPHLAAFQEAAKNWLERNDWLPAVIFHVLAYDKPEEAASHPLNIAKEFDGQGEDWRLGLNSRLHAAWYQPFRHDIIGNTLSADLLEYLHRDSARLGLGRRPDLKLLQHYVLVRWKPRRLENDEFWRDGRYRCAIDLHDHKRGTFRAERLNDIFRLLDLRHEIQEKAVTHRVVHSGVAMLNALGRSLADDLPRLPDIYGLAGPAPSVALAGDDQFLTTLWRKAEKRLTSASLARKLIERRMYRPLMVIPGDRVRALELACGQDEDHENVLRRLAAIVDSPHFEPFFHVACNCIQALLEHCVKLRNLPSHIRSLAGGLDRGSPPSIRNFHKVLLYTTPYKQLYKDPAILVTLNPPTGHGSPVVGRIDDLAAREAPVGIGDDLHDRLSAGVADLETKNRGLWKLYVFLSDDLFYCGPLMALTALEEFRGHSADHRRCLEEAAAIVVAALEIATGDRCEPTRWSTACPDLAGLLRNLANEIERRAERLKQSAARVSAVQFDQYIHASDSEACRDIRHKYQEEVQAEPSQREEIIKHTLESAEQEIIANHNYQALVKEIGQLLSGSQFLGTEDFREITLRLACGAETSNGELHLPKEIVDSARRGQALPWENLARVWARPLFG